MNYKEFYDIYFDYKQSKNNLKKIQNDLADIINEMLKITYQMKEDNSKKNTSNDKSLLLTAKKIELEQKRKLAIELCMLREKQKDDAEIELRKSVDLKDIIYVKYYIEHMRPTQISNELNFVRSYIYDILNIIKEEINKIKTDKIGQKT